jgi:uncharacterized membrane protein YfcA
VGRFRPLRWFLLWLALFYGAWLAYVVSAGAWASLAAHWPIALAMAAGSYVAGSTPMGGGSVGFPILVLLLGEPARLGRDFAFAIQALGMTSASIYILCTGRPLERRMLAWAMAGSLLATPLGVAFLAPRVDEVAVKMLFAVVWASFGLMHFVKLREICAATGITRTSAGFDRAAGLAAGALGGALIASVTGVGVDMLVYALLVLLARADLKIAIPTAVIGMAFTSVVGIATLAILSRAASDAWSLAPGLFDHWLAAAPVVVLGAPLGAFAVARVGRKPTLFAVSIVCAVQFVWMAWHAREQLGAGGLLVSLAGVLVFSAVLHLLYAAGGRLARRRGHLEVAP